MNRNKVKIEIWGDNTGFSPYIDTFKSIKDERTKDRIIKRNRFFEKLEFGQLTRSRDQMEKVKVRGLKELWELKYLITPPFRAVCFIWNDKLVLLMLMAGSGSDGFLTRFVNNKASTIRRMIESWKNNNNKK
ncbi:hypothetical protein A3A03_03850 [Candidatus Nomurabacteria bacterium RIFCSPLOWO2_01_FULL_40_18]|uniref:Uncharacterized protein n=1 Tax=Candidatus Nomurabacteria bacterium RIFCSPLOWO2_01_FULL_40_18 TaxID=1801773 RepID=A0A1F6XJQ7_9BACT|nr:MAG: hypothetical protein A3A03_03850 [Candidatus Nomurabacteria bacterium RIFCSPLOWO2_01_FULL_40_18]